MHKNIDFKKLHFILYLKLSHIIRVKGEKQEKEKKDTNLQSNAEVKNTQKKEKFLELLSSCMSSLYLRECISLSVSMCVCV